jgi:CheY-like chemotaxis protein
MSDGYPVSPVPAERVRPIVLVVDDNQVNRRIATVILAKMGCDSHQAVCGAAAIESCRARPYDLVLMDVAMPGMSGIEATRSIRSHEQPDGKRVPIIGLSGHASDLDRKEGLAAGMDEYLTKPMDIPHISRVLQRWIPSLVGNSSALGTRM